MLIRDCAFRFDGETWADIIYYIINNTKLVKSSQREYSNLYGGKAELSFSFALCPGTSIDLSLRNFYEDFLKYNYDDDDEEDDYDVLLRKDILNDEDEGDERVDEDNEEKANHYSIDLGLKDIDNFNYLQISIHSKFSANHFRSHNRLKYGNIMILSLPQGIPLRDLKSLSTV